MTTACSVPVSAAVALTTSAVNSPQVCTESEDTNSSSKSDKLEQPEAITEKSEGTSSAVSVQVDDKMLILKRERGLIVRYMCKYLTPVPDSPDSEFRLPAGGSGNLDSVLTSDSFT